MCNKITNSLHDSRNLEVQCRIHKGSPIIPILRRINPVPHIVDYLLKMHSNIVLPKPHSHGSPIIPILNWINSVRIYLPLFSTVLPSNSRLFLSCRPFVVITTFSTDLLDVEVTSVSWLGQLTDMLKTIPIEDFQRCYQKWEQCLHRCVAAQGNYFEGDDIIGEYQCGFRRNRSTVDHIFSILQIQ